MRVYMVTFGILCSMWSYYRGFKAGRGDATLLPEYIVELVGFTVTSVVILGFVRHYFGS